MSFDKKRFIGLIALISFLTNLVWESLQSSFFEGYQNFWQHFRLCVFATISDMFFITALYLFFAFAFKDFFWIRILKIGRGIVLILTGAFFAVIFEKIAISWGWWEYGKMPLIPFLDAGLLPVLQFAVLPLFSYVIAYSIYKMPV